MVVNESQGQGLREQVVGVPMRGPWSNYYLLLERLTDEHWLAYWRNP